MLTACLAIAALGLAATFALAAIRSSLWTLEGGRYARIVHTGPYTDLKTAYEWLYQTWLPNSGEEPRNLPCIEEYLNNPRQAPAKYLKTAVMMPLVG